MDEKTRGTDGGPRAIFRLIYRSQSLIDADARRTALGEVFATARRNNKRLDITGALMISDDSFVQVLEGDETSVRQLFATISGDPRHRQVTVLEAHEVGERTFGRWAMAEVAADGGADIRLMSNASK